MRVLIVACLVAACSASVSPPSVTLPVQAPGAIEAVHGSLIDRGRRHEIAHGVVVDIAARRVVRDLVAEHDFVQNDVVDGDLAYEQIHRYDEAHDDDVRAYRVSSGQLLWVAPQTCWSMVATSAGVFCDDAMGHVLLLRKGSGRARTVGRLGWNVSTLVRAGDRVVAVGRDVPRAAMFDAQTGAHVADLDLPARMRVGLAESGRVCGVADTLALCFDASPQILWTRSFPQRISVRMADARDMLVQTANESIALALLDGHMDAFVAGTMSTFVRAESGRLIGFVRQPPMTAFVDLDGRERWSTDAFPYANVATAIVTRDLVVIAAWNAFSAGASLEAFDHATGEARWVASVQTLPIAHSAYSNDVELRLEAGAIVMRGRESMQDYLEVFDPGSGARLLSTVRYRP